MCTYTSGVFRLRGPSVEIKSWVLAFVIPELVWSQSLEGGLGYKIY